MTIGIPQILAIVTLCLSICIFTLEVHRARELEIVGPEDHVLAAALGANAFAFILAFFIGGGPADEGSAWVVTFSLHSFIAGILTMIWVIMGGEDAQAEGSGQGLRGQAISSIVLAAFNFPMLLYMGVHHYVALIVDMKNNLKRLLCCISLCLTVVSFTCWLSTGRVDLWIHGLFIAGSLAAGLAAIDGLFIGNDVSFTFNSMIGSILSAIFFIAASVEVDIAGQSPMMLVAIIFAAFNCAILFFMGQQGKRGSIKEKSTLELILVGIAILTVVQFSIAMGVDVNAGGSWQHSILCWGAASIFGALFFHFIHFDHNARGVHIFMGLVGYVIFFISDCAAASEPATLATLAGDEKAYRVRICALVAAAGNCLLLLVATILTFPHIKTAAVAPADEATDPPQETHESSA